MTKEEARIISIRRLHKYSDKKINRPFDMSVDYGRIYKPSNRVQMQELSTLLDKALAYREENSRSWEAREKDREETFLETFGIYEDDPFLTDYYKKQDEKVQKRKVEEAKRKFECPKLYIKLKYTILDFYEHLSESSDSLEDTYRRDSLRPGSDPGEADAGIFKMSPSRRSSSIKPTVCSELTINIAKAKYLLNWLDVGERKYDLCKVKCVLYPRNKKSTKKLKTREAYVNLKGTTRFNHVFKLQGFTLEELEERYIELEVIGMNNQRKDVIGKVILGGIKTMVTDSNLNSRGLTTGEYEPWQEVIHNSGKCFNIQLDMKKPQDVDFFDGETHTQMNRSQLLKATPSPRGSRKLKSRSPVKKNKLKSL